MKKILKVLGIIVGVVVLLIIFLVVKNYIDSQKPIVEENYYESFSSDYGLEKKYSGLGEYAVASESFETSEGTIKKYRVWYPTEMETTNNKYPLIVVTNASNTAALNYEPWFSRLASCGFVVAGNEDRGAGSGESTSKTLSYLLKLNSQSDSKFYSKIDENNIGCVGYSQGGAGAIRAVTEFDNSDKFKTLFTGSAAYSTLAKNMGWGYDASKINISYFMTASTGSSDDTGVANIETEYGGVSPLASLVENYNAISDSVLKVRARIKNAEHGDMLEKADGYMTAWMLYILKSDAEASKVFVGESAEITTNTGWQDIEKNN